ncbi:MAG: hypothetical protein KJZ47_15025 [Gemmatimonadales bacterium]|nr:hypothetical protein [Gemmatimonadales bacterium]
MTPGAETALGTVGIVLGTLALFVGIIVLAALTIRFPGGEDDDYGGFV